MFLIYLLSLIIFPSTLGMQLTKRPSSLNQKFIRTVIGRSPELDAIRKQWRFNNTPQKVVDISQGKIVIKEKVPLGKRYGTAHNYAFTKTMGIVGKAPKQLNILGMNDYYGDHYLKIYDFFDFLEPNAVLQPGDIAVYFTKDEKGFAGITHTGIVVGDDCIESKWGIIRGILHHPVWYVPAGFGDHCRYLRPKISGDELFAEVQKRLQEKEIKERYDGLAQAAQKLLFGYIKKYEQDRSNDNFQRIYEAFEMNINVHVDIVDENYLTPWMHVENIGCHRLDKLFAKYQKYNE